MIPIIIFVLKSAGIENAEDLKVALEKIRAVEAKVSAWMKAGNS